MQTIPYILATAGHVDHGKSALVRALTGIDPDRLPEEKARGITIDLGFAHLELPAPTGASVSLGIIDVPGHEDFVKNMVAGIGSIDLCLLVIAADDGWMPQTEEHLQILNYLGVNRGVVALTKVDLIDSDQTFRDKIHQKLTGTPLEGAPIIATSMVSGRGLDQLKLALAQAAAAAPPQPDIGKPRLPIDRVFTLKGIGTVVTGTLTGGQLQRGQAVVIQPSGRGAHIRNIQTHNRDVELAIPGSRVALNLPELDQSTIARGDVVTRGDLGAASAVIDVLLERSPRSAGSASPRILKDGALVHLHHGSGDIPATVHLLETKRLAPGERALAQLRPQRPIFAFAGDHLVLRDWPAQHTLAGAVVLDPDASPGRVRSAGRLAFLHQRAAAPGAVEALLTSLLIRDGFLGPGALLKSRFSPDELNRASADLVASGQAVTVGEFTVEVQQWRALSDKAAAAIDADHRVHPQHLGLKLLDLRAAIANELPHADLFEALVQELCRQGFIRAGAVIHRASHQPSLPANLRAAGEKLRSQLSARPFEPPSRQQLAPDKLSAQALHFLLDTGQAVAISDDLIMLAEHLQRAGDIIRTHIATTGPATASQLRQLLGTTRRVIVPLLEYLDGHGLTVRQGDLRALRQH